MSMKWGGRGNRDTQKYQTDTSVLWIWAADGKGSRRTKKGDQKGWFELSPNLPLVDVWQ